MNLDPALIDRLGAGLEAAIRAEEQLDTLLSRQEEALKKGAADEVLETSAALEPAYEALREAMEGCRHAVLEIDERLGLARGTPLRGVLKEIPAELSPTLAERRDRLVAVRRRARRRSARNATLARASLDAIRTVRGLLAGEAPPTVAVGSSGRLDAQA
ncbi:MAG: flagellar export chaperone FlgN [Planctomycetota bacterium JB042]